MQKTKDAYKTIGEVAQEIGLKNKRNKKLSTHTLRFWERHFKQIKPKVLSGNRSYYSKKDIETGMKLLELLVDNKIMNSKSEARRAINNKGVKINNLLVADENKILSLSDFKDENLKISFGKKKHFLFKIT